MNGLYVKNIIHGKNTFANIEKVAVDSFDRLGSHNGIYNPLLMCPIWYRSRQEVGIFPMSTMSLVLSVIKIIYQKLCKLVKLLKCLKP